MVEASARSKCFILKMDVLPEQKLLRMYDLHLGGVGKFYVPISSVIPITRYDYAEVQTYLFFKQNPCLDLEMVYADRTNKTMYVFDKFGEW